jgi:16S rRNA (guanine966-N2)-methyltransferase
LRIIAGDLARRNIVAPKGSNTRPTSDRVREALFQHLVSARLDDGFNELSILDLFAGSGSLSYEAISRGASYATLVEADPLAARAIKENVETLGLESKVTVLRDRLPKALRRVRGTFDVCFLDPPYAEEPILELAATLSTLARPGALLVYEHSARVSAPDLAEWDGPEHRIYGETQVSFYTVISSTKAADDGEVAL